MRFSSGEAIDLDTFCGNFISECEKTEETLMNSWLGQVVQIFSTSTSGAGSFSGVGVGERRRRFYACASVLLSIQLRDLLMRSVTSFVDIFADRRSLPRIEVLCSCPQAVLIRTPLPAGGAGIEGERNRILAGAGRNWSDDLFSCYRGAAKISMLYAHLALIVAQLCACR